MEWLHPNADEMGYYRWNLPPGDLRTLVTRANQILTPRERVATQCSMPGLRIW